MIVLDASALVDVVADRPVRDLVLDQLVGEIVAPAHQLAEVSAAVVRLVRSGELTSSEGRRAIEDASALILEFVPLDHGLLERAYSLRESVRVLDGMYVALAERLDATLVTTDRRLARSSPPCRVILVSTEG